jgi:hypothetical protein
MRNIRYGLLAGALAGVLLVALLYVDEGPANQLILVAQTFGLDGRGASKVVAAGLILALGTLIGGLFGILLRQRPLSRGNALVWGLAAGVLWWAVLFVLLGDVIQRLVFPPYGMMLYLALSLVYGLVLGSIYSIMQQGQTR